MSINPGDKIEFELRSFSSIGRVALVVVYANNRFVQGWVGGFFSRCHFSDMCNVKFLGKV